MELGLGNEIIESKNDYHSRFRRGRSMGGNSLSESGQLLLVAMTVVVHA